MSQETRVDQMETCSNVEADIVLYSTRLAGRTIERALDVIYEESNDKDPKIHEWRHSLDKMTSSDN